MRSPGQNIGNSLAGETIAIGIRSVTHLGVFFQGNSSSDGSSIEAALHELMDRKAEQTVEFFSHIYGKAPNADAIRLLMGSQFWYFRQLLDRHMEESRMLTCLQAVLDFTNAGWRQLCDTLQ